MNIAHIVKMLLLAAQCEVLFGFRNVHEIHRIRIHLEDDERLIIPNKHRPVPTVKIFHLPHPFTGDKFYTDLSKINKKRTKHVKHNTPVGKLKSSLKPGVEKKCCGNEWTTSNYDDKEVVPLEDLFQPVSLPTAQIHGYRKVEDIKPVTERIEDDLKYDFRTKTHSF